ncbi:MAG TPA: exodeoxyribonuclease V subunit gamma [Spirochaetota bacterium]|nr:exodeoxyribonuclease V subunit gamma [Spirochaetota bacterium]
MPVKLYYSNTIDELCAALAGHLARERENPLGADVVFIPNPHLREWVQMRLADVNGIAANIDFQFLDPGLWKLIRRIRERTGPCPGLLDATQLRLVLYYLLTEKSVAGKGPGHPGVLMPAGEHGPEHETRAWQLAGKLAVNFSAYEHRRPDMIEAWKSGRLVFDTGMERAQRSLYLKALGPKGLCAGAFNGAMSLPAHARETDFASAGPCLPVIHFFCESQLSPFHAGLVFGLGSAADVYVYHLNPCSEFWEDVETPVEERWRKIRSVRVGEDSQGEYLDYTPEENRLLQAWGRAGREDVKLMSMVEEACIGSVEFEASWVGQTASAQENTVLGQLQRRIMARSSGGELLAQDRSVQIARCQTVYREVESVYASILHSLERDPSLKMTDIAVYVPDMEMYGPVIKSVFSREQRISMGMIDFTAASESVVGEAVIALFELARGDFTRSEVFTLVMNPAFQKARGIDSRDAETWLKWADSLNIFRGFSSDGNTAGESCTWQQGLRRLRMGRVMEGPSDALQSYRGIVPFADMNSNDSEQVGAISLSLELLHSIIAPVRTGELSAQEWLGVIDELIARFIAVPDSIPGEETVLMGLRRAWMRSLCLTCLFCGAACHSILSGNILLRTSGPSPVFTAAISSRGSIYRPWCRAARCRSGSAMSWA